jgi:hypothetical protein
LQIVPSDGLNDDRGSAKTGAIVLLVFTPMLAEIAGRSLFDVVMPGRWLKNSSKICVSSCEIAAPMLIRHPVFASGVSNCHAL